MWKHGVRSVRVASWMVPIALAGAQAGCGDHADRSVIVLAGHDVTTDEDTPIDVAVLDGAADPAGRPLTLTGAAIAGGSAAGHTIEVRGDLVHVVPRPDFHGTIDVTYGVTDGVLTGGGAFLITVRPVNDPPVALGGAQTVHGPAVLVLPARDVDDDALTFEIVDPPAHGTVTGTSPMLRYEPAAGYVGDDALTYRARRTIMIGWSSGPVTASAMAAGAEPATTWSWKLAGAEAVLASCVRGR
jgi:hypothetical protein